MPVGELAIGIAYRDKKMIATKIAMIPMTIGIHRKIARSKNPPTLKAEGPVPTYANDTIIVIPPAPTPEEDMRLLRDTGRRMAREYFENHPRAWEKSS
ncbi:MAG: hypothetical protein IIB28_04240 [Chloroflexi bacterium]|nr:hypothetical protein [Chloroflexota bacterium]